MLVWLWSNRNQIIISSSLPLCKAFKSKYQTKKQYQPTAFVYCIFLYVRVYTCMEPDLSQGHPWVQRSLFGGTALQGGGHLRQSLLYTTGCYRCSMNRTWRKRIKPSQKRLLHVLTSTSAVLGSHVPQCRVLTRPNTAAGFTDPHNLREKRGTVKRGVFVCSKKLSPHWHTVSCPCTKAFNQSTPFHTLQHTVLWPWINQVKMN